MEPISVERMIYDMQMAGWTLTFPAFGQTRAMSVVAKKDVHEVGKGWLLESSHSFRAAITSLWESTVPGASRRDHMQPMKNIVFHDMMENSAVSISIDGDMATPEQVNDLLMLLNGQPLNKIIEGATEPEETPTFP